MINPEVNMKVHIICLLAIFSAGVLRAQNIPSLVNYQGRLLDAGGNPRSGNVSIMLSVHTAETGGSQVYTETINPVPVNNGLFSIHFGGQTGFAAALANAEAWLEVRVDGSQVGPRSRLVAVPYAAAAGTVRGANLYEHPTTGNIGMGTSTPAQKLEVTGHALVKGTQGFNAGGEQAILYLGDTHQKVASEFSYGLRLSTFGVESGLVMRQNSGNVGIGTVLPGEKLEVNGAVKIGTTSNPTPAAGTIRWTGSAFEGFNGTAWTPLGQTPPLVNIEMVTVGNPGNADDPNGNGLGGNSGSVGYIYQIGKYEVTNSEYCNFLNAVDPNGLNALALYNVSMGSDIGNGGIAFNSGNADGAKYSVKSGFANKPVVYVSFYDAMRFCNWLHNGAQPGGDTENGAYTLLGNSATPSNGTTVTRNAGAKFAVPSEDEWYKAAYHQPQAQGGDTDGFWLYPTRSNTAPNASPPPGTYPAANLNFTLGQVSTVGAYLTTVGYYGTFDMAGNVQEWSETIYTSFRVNRGGRWSAVASTCQSIGPNWEAPDYEYFNLGFRVLCP
jgi:sulfatase modifying factor 1